MIDYAAWMENYWNDLVLSVCKALEVYSMNELWSIDIARFIKLTQKAEQIIKNKMKNGKD